MQCVSDNSFFCEVYFLLCIFFCFLMKEMTITDRSSWSKISVILSFQYNG